MHTRVSGRALALHELGPNKVHTESETPFMAPPQTLSFWNLTTTYTGMETTGRLSGVGCWRSNGKVCVVEARSHSS